ncbi:MAG: hypothetical protein HY302_15490 [Opitutae bacterium]|nr:hypothetical protein [Opitutae bacterium]
MALPPPIQPLRIGLRLDCLRLFLLLALIVISAKAATPRYIFTHLAGSIGGGGRVDGTGADARFRSPGKLAVDHADNLYVVDRGNHTIRKVTPGGVVTTLAGTPGQVGSVDGIGPVARFDDPDGIAVDSSGNVFVADTANLTIRKITPTGTVATLAGSPGQSGSADGVGAAARFAGLSYLVIDRSDNLYALDEDRMSGRHSIRKITATGGVTTLSVTDDRGQPVTFREFTTLAVDPAGNLLVADLGERRTVERFLRIHPAGTATAEPAPRHVGPIGASVIDSASNLYLTYPLAALITKPTPGEIGIRPVDATGLAVDSAGNLFVALNGDNVICKVTPDGRVTTFAGLAAESGQVDGTGGNARFSAPLNVAVDTVGNIYVADDAGNGVIRRVSPDGAVRTVITFSQNRTLGNVSSIVLDTAGNILAVPGFVSEVCQRHRSRQRT